MSHPLEGCRLKIERAKEHFRALEAEWAEFAKLEPFGTSYDDFPETRERVLRARVSLECPRRWSLIVGDIVHNLRAALDHLVWQLVIANGETPDDQTGFPICTTQRAYSSSRGRMLRGVSAAAEAMIDRLQPYHLPDIGPPKETGEMPSPEEDFLWMLHRLDIMDKHRLLNVVVAGFRHGDFSVSPPPGEVAHIEKMEVFPERLCPIEDGALLIRIRMGGGADLTMGGQWRYETAFDPEGPGKGAPLRGFLKYLITIVEGRITFFAPLVRSPEGDAASAPSGN